MKAVLLIIFNRPGSTQKVFDAIRQAQPQRLYIAADAPRETSDSDQLKCNQAKLITEQIDWPCEVKRLYQEKNLGCSWGPRAAFHWFFNYEKEGIILEDDCLPHPDFFEFTSVMLDKYRDNKKVISINGSNLGYKSSNASSYTFSRFMNMWGWATWADRANEIDYSLQSWKQVKYPLLFLYIKMRHHFFDFDINWYKYWQHKFDLTVTVKNVTWWDWQWIWHQTLHDRLSIVPSANLVTNIGFSEDATHTKVSDNPAANITTEKLNIPLIHPASFKIDLKYEENIVKQVWCSYKRLPTLFYAKMFLKQAFTKNSA